MILYRVISKNNIGILNQPWKGINTFKYENDKKYVHFYFFPQHADFLQKTKYKNDGIILKCDIPIELLEFGIGLYNWHNQFKKEPFLEARIEYLNFKNEFIIEKKDKIDNSWKKPLLYQRYLNDCIYQQTSYSYVDKNNCVIILNKNFDFYYYIYENYHKNKLEELYLYKKILINLRKKIYKTEEKKLIK